MTTHLFTLGAFTLHSGQESNWKIDCDALTGADIECIAMMMVEHMPAFHSVYGIPRGGWRLERALMKYITEDAPRMLIVDDVYTTGTSMREARERYPRSFGAVIFARAQTPGWVYPLFAMPSHIPALRITKESSV